MPVDIAGLYRQAVGSDIDPQAHNYLSSLMRDGQIDDFDLSQIIQGLPQAQEFRGRNAQAEFGQMLGASDQQILGQAAQAAAVNARQRGVSDSSSIGAATLSAGQGLAQSRQAALAQFYAGNQSQLAQAYANMGQAGLGHFRDLQAEKRQRQYDIEDYYRQKNDYEDAQNSANRVFGNPLLGRIANGALNLGAAYLGGKSGSTSPAKLGEKAGK